MIPALDEAAVIGETVRQVVRFLDGWADAFQLVVVDDGSSDGTADEVERATDDPRVELLRHPACRGKGAAIRSGVAASRLDHVLFTDADLSMPIEELERVWELLESADVVVASKRCGAAEIDYPPLRRLTGAFGQMLIHTFVVRGISDTQGGFKLFRGDVARALFRVQRLDGFGFDFEVLYLARRYGWRVTETPFRGRHRIGGSITLRSYLRTLGEVGRVVAAKVLRRYPAAPPSGAPDPVDTIATS
ncbi:Undecaprenyl-phosphate mannosyltransferase [Planctomycetes bacterium Pla163]|uniref:Undecaprenyl-phosphate mannosyltransferase n=1 Tax=Rohdeia mirabilis TaxID=2528008 RepID=A0A518D5A0_9BACT|nr:Undecaprenyl-phosphate mannosyltransferase [Planctomycetes bacterium Pla163]